MIVQQEKNEDDVMSGGSKKNMEVLVLGCGIQGKAALYDLSKNEAVARVVAADLHPETIQGLDYVDPNKVRGVQLDVRDRGAMVSLMGEGFDVVIELLPPEFTFSAAEAAVEAGVSLVNSMYACGIQPLHESAVKKGISIMPECGLDPGLDLVLYAYGLQQFDELHVLNSYCGGLPEKKAAGNPLGYKISWNWDAVLKSQKRDAVLIKDRKVVHVSGEDQQDNPFVHRIDFPGLGKLEALPNGNAVHFTDFLGITKTLRETGRYSLRWPGWCSFWRPLKKFDCLSDVPVSGLPCEVSPRQFFVKWLEPQLQYGDDEKDLAVLKNVYIGVKGGREKRLSVHVLIERELSTGLMAMALGVSYPACIAAEMIATGEIDGKGILSPARDIPVDLFLARLRERGIKVEESTEI